jgi:hypothetical protein
MDVVDMRRLLWRWETIEEQLVPQRHSGPRDPQLRRTNLALAQEQKGIEQQLERAGITIRYVSPAEFCLSIKPPPS